MNLDELRAVQDREREKDSLQHLRDTFYEEVGTYIADLREERERRADMADDPFADPEVRRLTDEIQTAEEVAESIYERRMGKVVKTASLAAAGYTADTEGLTEEEAALFDDLVERIEANQDTVLDVLSGRREAARDDSAGEAGAASGAAVDGDGSAVGGDGTAASGEGAAAGGDGPVAGDATAAGGDGTGTGDGVAPSDGAIAGHDGASLDGDRTVDAASGDGSVDAVSGDGDSPADDLGPPGVDGPSRDGDAAASGPSAGDAAAGDGATAADSSASGASAAGDESTTAVDGDGAASAVESDGESPEDADVASGFDAAAAMGDPDRVTVRITDDVGEIVGVDGTAYDLATDDVVTLPEANAEPLLEKDAATRVE